MSLYRAHYYPSRPPIFKFLPLRLRHWIICKGKYRYRHYCIGHGKRIKRYGSGNIYSEGREDWPWWSSSSQ